MRRRRGYTPVWDMLFIVVAVIVLVVGATIYFKARSDCDGDLVQKAGEVGYVCIEEGP